MHHLNFKKLIRKFLLLTFFLVPLFTFASTTSGIIDSNYNLAWGENLAWINFSANNDVTITDFNLTGNIWSQTYGWINLNPTPYGGVKNDGEGNLSGFAWGQDVGWINFQGAKINTSGKFTGVVGDASTTAGRISFDCAQCDVETDWRPVSVRASLPVTYTNPPHGHGGSPFTLPVTPTNLPSVANPNTPPPENISSSQVTKFKFTKLLKLGSTGNEVKELQKVLKLKPDGKFGQNTLKALKAFQIKNKIAKPGVAGYGQVGPKTRDVLNKINK